MKRKNRRLLTFTLSLVLLSILCLAFLRMNPPTPLLTDRARQIYTFAPGCSGVLGWQTDHSFLYSVRQAPFARLGSQQGVYHIYDVDSRTDKQVVFGPMFMRPLVSMAYFPPSTFEKALEAYSRQVDSGPQGHADIHLENGRAFNQLWLLASYAGTSHVVFTDRISRAPSALETLWLRYIVRKPIPRPKECGRIWTCRRDGTHLHLVGEGPLLPIPKSPLRSSPVYTLQQCRLSDDEKTLRFVWGGGVWSVPVED